MKNVDEKVSYTEFFENVKTVYSWLEDDTSRNLFNTRMLYNTSGNLDDYGKYASDYIKNTMKSNNKCCVWNVELDDNETIIIYGAGLRGRKCLEIIRGSNNYGESRQKSNCNVLFCDQNHDKIKEHCGIKVISPEELFEKYKDCKVVIANIFHFMEIYDFLSANNVTNFVFDVIADFNEQYFDELIKFTDNEIFIDAGVYDGNSSLEFAKCCPNYKEIHLCEPNKECYETISTNLKELQNIKLHEVGLWNKKDVLMFADNDVGSSSSTITNDGNIKIEVDSLDNILRGMEPATFIKMDIEGAELNALKGAKETIMKYKPKLAISVYHKPEDIIEILMYIKSLVPEYKFYLRHYTNSWSETILYAVI